MQWRDDITFPLRRLWLLHDVREWSAYPPKFAVNADIPAQRLGGQQRTRAVQQKLYGYSMISSASNWIEFVTSMPSALAVCRLMTNSNLVDCKTGRSAGFAPLRI